MESQAQAVEHAIRISRKYFGLELPTTADELKAAFREASKKYHPDTGGPEASNEAFVRMKEAYDFLSELRDSAVVFRDNGDRRFHASTADDNTPLSELGLGLGPTQNGTDCPVCKHKGYLQQAQEFYETCRLCHGSCSVPLELPCRACNGTGEFQQLRSGRIVTCRACKGSKKFVHPTRRGLCSGCWGLGRVSTATGQIRYSRCYKCRGTGELEIANPVIPKGRLW